MGNTSFPLHRSPGRGQRIGADLTLLLVSIIWGSAFVAQRIAAVQMGVFWFNGLRFLLGALVLLPFAWRERVGAQNQERRAGMRRVLPGILAAGALLWGGAALQQAGLRYTTAGNAGFITGLYVVLIPLILAISGRSRPGWMVWTASGMAALGLFLLSTGGQMRMNPGDGLELAGAFFWALHVILIGWLVRRIPVLDLSIGQYLVCAALSIATGWWVEQGVQPALLQGWWAILYTGVLSVGLGYTLQAKGQRLAPPADAAVILSSEAVFAALFGWIILSERLAPLQLLGCGIMFAGMLLVQYGSLRRNGEESAL